jgi:cytochrome c553
MQSIRLGLTLCILALVSACGDATAPDGNGSAQTAPSMPGPWDTLAALAPADQPYGLDVYTAKCLSCHGDLGQGVDKNPALKGLTSTAMQNKLLEFRAGSIKGDQAAVMTQAVSSLSDAEIAAVSIYAGE